MLFLLARFFVRFPLRATAPNVRNNNFRDIYKPPEALEVVFAKCLCWVIDIFIHILFY